MTQPLVRFQGVHKFYGHHHVLRDLNLQVNRGEVTVLIGPSGSGKSTLLRCVNRMETIQAGRVWVGDELMGYRERDGRLYQLKDREIAAQRSEIGMVFQKFNLFGHKTALENIMEAPRFVKGRSKNAAEQLGMDLLQRVGLADRAHYFPAHLSGGQQQRVAIARALAMEPQLMLFDEPTSALDPELVGDVLQIMKELAQAGMTMMVVTHEINFAREVADSLVFMDGGVILESGVPHEVIASPRHERTREFLRRVV